MERDFAELIARLALEPELAERYEQERDTVLAQFGLTGMDPALAEGLITPEPVVTIEELHDKGNEATLFCTCTRSGAGADSTATAGQLKAPVTA